MEYTDSLANSLFRYFTVLENTGYYNPNKTNGLLMYLFIVEAVFEGALSEYLDDNGLTVFNNVLDCLHRNGCFVPASAGVKLSKPRGAKLSEIRVSESAVTRYSEDQNPRFVEP